jgi:hypothetical protein
MIVELTKDDPPKMLFLFHAISSLLEVDSDL